MPRAPSAIVHRLLLAAGALLVAGVYLAISSFCSALTRSQAVAFVLSLILCLLLALAGSQPVVDLLARWRAGGRQNDGVLQALTASIGGIAYAMQGTG